MRKCGKLRCQICKYVEEGNEFEEGKRKFYIDYSFDCDSEGVIYLISCVKFRKNYVGSTITSFKKRFNNHKSSINRYGRGQRKIEYMLVTIIDKTNINEPTQREGF